MYWVLPRNFHEHCTKRAHQDTDNSIEVVPRESQGYKTSTLSANSLLGVLESIISVLIYFVSENLYHILVVLAIRQMSPIF
jgi:hypothetical protein